MHSYYYIIGSIPYAVTHLFVAYLFYYWQFVLLSALHLFCADVAFFLQLEVKFLHQQRDKDSLTAILDLLRWSRPNTQYLQGLYPIARSQGGGGWMETTKRKHQDSEGSD